jgi:hypothetical protein
MAHGTKRFLACILASQAYLSTQKGYLNITLEGHAMVSRNGLPQSKARTT